MTKTQRWKKNGNAKVEFKGNGGKSALFNLKDTAILYGLLNLIWLLQMMLFETSIELNNDSTNFRFPLGVIYLNKKDLH